MHSNPVSARLKPSMGQANQSLVDRRFQTVDRGFELGLGQANQNLDPRFESQRGRDLLDQSGFNLFDQILDPNLGLNGPTKQLNIHSNPVSGSHSAPQFNSAPPPGFNTPFQTANLPRAREHPSSTPGPQITQRSQSRAQGGPPRYSQASSSQQGSHPRVGQRSERGGGRGNGRNTEADYLEHHGQSLQSHAASAAPDLQNPFDQSVVSSAPSRGCSIILGICRICHHPGLPGDYCDCGGVFQQQQPPPHPALWMSLCNAKSSGANYYTGLDT